MPGTGSEANDEVVMKALAKDPVRRHQTGREFARELQAAYDIALRSLPVFMAGAAADQKPRATFFTCHRAPCPDHSPRAPLVGKFRDRQSGKVSLCRKSPLLGSESRR